MVATRHFAETQAARPTLKTLMLIDKPVAEVAASSLENKSRFHFFFLQFLGFVDYSYSYEDILNVAFLPTAIFSKDRSLCF
jgi:hypothetical protein